MKNKKTLIAIAVILLAVIGAFGSTGDDSGAGINEGSTAAASEALSYEESSEESSLTEVSLEESAEAEQSSEPEKLSETEKAQSHELLTGSKGFSLSSVGKFSGKAYVAVNGNIPGFSKSEVTRVAFEEYGELDYLGRCSGAFACLGKELMPTEERGSIGQVKPSGWHTVKYDFVDGKYLYNRCHLIGFQLSGENANPRNLITGTRYMNVQGMLPFENMLADYIKETGNHVMYRVTPIFDGINLVATGVQLEAYSVEDEGDGICFNVFCYNAQPGVEINYSDGSSSLSRSETTITEAEAVQKENNAVNTQAESENRYILNTNSKKFHYSSCRAVKNMSEENKSQFSGNRNSLINQGYSPCGICNP